MSRDFSIAMCAALASMMVASLTFAQDKKPEDYLKKAEPFMNLSCQALVDTYGDNAEEMGDIVELMVAVSVINRQIDITKFLANDDDKAEFGQFLQVAVTTLCEEDVHSLLAGNVDRVVAFAFADESDQSK